MMLDLLPPVAALSLLVASVVAGIIAIYHASHMFLETAPSRSWIANLFPYLSGSLPGLLTEKGQRSRNKFVLWLWVALACGGASGAIVAIFRTGA